MNKEIRKLFGEVVGVSLNSDQVNVIAQSMNRGFDIRNATGFGAMIAIPGHAAAEALIHFLVTEEKAVEFFERMLDQEGKFIYDSVVKIVYRDEFIKLLAKYKWIFDPDTRRFMRDPFYAEQLNFLKNIEFLDLRRAGSIGGLGAMLKEESARLKVEDLTWQVTLRTYRMSQQVAELIRDLLELLLRKQNLEQFTGEIYTALNELAINASKATYKKLFEKHVTEPAGIDSAIEYEKFAEKFRDELDEHGDTNVAKYAEQDDKYFEIHFKSTDAHISCWTTNYTTISRKEKLRLLRRLNYTLFGQNLDEVMSDPEREGAGLGINLVLTILGRISKDKHPLKPVFYQDRTKMGFVLKRVDLDAAREQRKAEMA